MPGGYRYTKIIATIGPATESRDHLKRLIVGGVDVLRINMAHATGEWVASLVRQIREVSVEVTRHVAVMMDVKGPEIRTGVVASPIDLKTGDTFELFTEVTIQNALGYLKRRHWCEKGTWLVVITNVLAHDKVVDTLQLRRVE